MLADQVGHILFFFVYAVLLCICGMTAFAGKVSVQNRDRTLAAFSMGCNVVGVPASCMCGFLSFVAMFGSSVRLARTLAPAATVPHPPSPISQGGTLASAIISFLLLFACTITQGLYVFFMWKSVQMPQFFAGSRARMHPQPVVGQVVTVVQPGSAHPGETVPPVYASQPAPAAAPAQAPSYPAGPPAVYPTMAMPPPGSASVSQPYAPAHGAALPFVPTGPEQPQAFVPPPGKSPRSYAM